MAMQPGGAPASIVVAGIPQGWSASFCGCCGDCGTCFYGCFCFPCLYGSNYSKVRGGGCFGPCVFHALCLPCDSCCNAPKLREDIRFKYNLEEAPASDFIVHCCPCTHCLAVCQEASELKRRGATAFAPVGGAYAVAAPRA